jgi:hypothetical protein
LELAPAAGVDCVKFNQNFRIILNLERKAAGSDYPEPLQQYHKNTLIIIGKG